MNLVGFVFCDPDTHRIKNYQLNYGEAVVGRWSSSPPFNESDQNRCKFVIYLNKAAIFCWSFYTYHHHQHVMKHAKWFSSVIFLWMKHVETFNANENDIFIVNENDILLRIGLKAFCPSRTTAAKRYKFKTHCNTKTYGQH